MLQGTFETLALPELLGLLASARKTGALRLEAGPASGVVHLEDGHCRAVETVEQMGRTDGPALLSRLVDVCFAVTRQENGAFRFASDDPAPWRSDEPVELSDALVEVDRLLKQWREILQVIPSLDCRPRLLEQLEGEEVVLDRAHWALLVVIDGHRSVRDLVQHADRPVIDVCHSLLELVEAGAVGILDPAAAAPAPAPAPVTAAPEPAPAPTAPAPVQATPAPAPAPEAPAPEAAPAQSAPTSPQPVAVASAPAEPAPAPVAPQAAESPAPAPAPAANANGANGNGANGNGANGNGNGANGNGNGQGNGNAIQARAEAESAPADAEPAGDEGGDAPDKGAFLRLFSGLRDG